MPYLPSLIVCVTLGTACHRESASEPTPPSSPSVIQPVVAEAPAPAPAPVALPVRRFLEVVGEVKMGSSKAVVGAEIGESVSITTGKNAHAVITLQPQSVIEIGPQSRVEIGSSPRKTMSLKMLVGSLWNMFPRGQASYEVVAPHAVAGVRGTVFYVAASKKDTYVCACDGEIDLQTTGTTRLPRKWVSHNEHKGVSLRGKGKKMKESPAQRHGHTEERASALQSLLLQTQATP